MNYRYSLWQITRPPALIESESKLSPDVLRAFIGGYLEIIHSGAMFYIMDEDGRLKGKPRNTAFPALVGTVITTQNGV